MFEILSASQRAWIRPTPKSAPETVLGSHWGVLSEIGVLSGLLVVHQREREPLESSLGSARESTLTSESTPESSLGSTITVGVLLICSLWLAGRISTRRQEMSENCPEAPANCEPSGPLQHSKVPQTPNLSKISPDDCFSGFQSGEPKVLMEPRKAIVGIKNKFGQLWDSGRLSEAVRGPEGSQRAKTNCWHFVGFRNFGYVTIASI